jgi:predicted small metal-binding protein
LRKDVSHLPTEVTVKVVHCECGTDVQGESDDELVAAVEAHVQEKHPDMVGKIGREQILEMAHDH